VADIGMVQAKVSLTRANGNGDLRYTMLWIEATLFPITHTVQALIYKDIDTCVVGDACGGGTCTGLFNDNGALVVSFQQNGNFRAVSPDNPLCATAPLSKRVRLTMSAAQVAERRASIDEFRANVFRWSGHEINLVVNVLEVGTTKMGLSQWGPGLWMAPWDVDAEGRKAISRFTDFTIVTAGIKTAPSGCTTRWAAAGEPSPTSSRVTAALVIAGCPTPPAASPSSAVTRARTRTSGCTRRTPTSTCYRASQTSITTPPPPTRISACGLGDPDATKWFPDLNQCKGDPDSTSCGGDCVSNDAINSHILGKHWAAGRRLTANRCRDGVQDFNETAVDVGPDCPAVVTRTPAASGVTASANDAMCRPTWWTTTLVPGGLRQAWVSGCA
jgi:hypothetical protein